MSNLPNNIEAENAVIGSILLDKEIYYIAKEMIDSKDFHDKKNSIIFDAMNSLIDSSRNVDVITVGSYLKDNGHSDITNSFLNDLLAQSTIPESVKSYVDIIREKSRRRQTVMSAEELSKKAFDTETDISETIQKTEINLSNLLLTNENTRFASSREVCITFLEDMQSREPGTLSGVGSSFKKLDDMTDGFQKGDYIILAGRTSHGKSALSECIAEYVAMTEKKGVALFNLEMTNKQAMARMIGSRAMVEAEKIKKQQLNDDEYRQFLSMADQFASQDNLWLNDSGYTQLFDMKVAMRKLIREHDNIALMIVDHIGLMKDKNYKGGNRQEELSGISHGIKLLAKELKIPIIVLSQLNRNLENRGDGRPQLSDLKSSGSLEEDADVVVLIDRPEQRLFDKCPEEDKGKANIIVPKNRNGRCGEFILNFDKKYTRFSDVYVCNDNVGYSGSH